MRATSWSISPERGIEDLCRNPLTLRMLGEVAQEELVLPDSRAELFDRACCVMLKEDNPRHSRDLPRAERRRGANAGVGRSVCDAGAVQSYRHL